MRSATAVQAVASSAPAPHTLHASQEPAPAATLNVEPAAHAVHVFGLLAASRSWKPDEHSHVRSATAVQAVASCVPEPHVVQVSQATKVPSLNCSAAHGTQLVEQPDTIAPPRQFSEPSQ